jgi:uncharacterized protein DUF5615
MKLLVDMNLSPRWVDVLADAGIEAAHGSTLGASNAPDAQIMAYIAITMKLSVHPRAVIAWLVEALPRSVQAMLIGSARVSKQARTS